jgi:hypothetical protein
MSIKHRTQSLGGRRPIVGRRSSVTFCSHVIIRQRVDARAPPDDRLRRMIQYAATHRLNLICAEYWMPAFAGMTAVFDFV